MINFDVTKENLKKHNQNWLKIPYHLYKILIIGGSESGNWNPLFSLKKKMQVRKKNTDKIYLYAKDPYEVNYSFYLQMRKYRIKAFKQF